MLTAVAVGLAALFLGTVAPPTGTGHARDLVASRQVAPAVRHVLSATVRPGPPGG